MTNKEIKQLSESRYKLYIPKDIIDVVTKDPFWIKHLGVRGQTEQICLAAVKRDVTALKYVWNQTEAICLEAVKNNGSILVFVKEQTEAICLAAVKEDWHVLRFVKEQTEAIIKAALEGDKEAIYYADPRVIESLADEVKELTVEEIEAKSGYEVKIVK